MTFNEYIDLRNDPRHPLECRIYRVSAPVPLPPVRLASRTARSGAVRPIPRPAPTPRPPARSLAPRYVCAICGTAAPVDAKFRCSPCAAEIALGVKHAQSGLRVVP